MALKPKLNDEHKATTTRRRKQSAKRSDRYCLCKSARPAGLMVQYDTCRDWFQPKCVGENKEYVKDVQNYYCSDCTLVVMRVLGGTDSVGGAWLGIFSFSLCNLSIQEGPGTRRTRIIEPGDFTREEF